MSQMQRFNTLERSYEEAKRLGDEAVEAVSDAALREIVTSMLERSF